MFYIGLLASFMTGLALIISIKHGYCGYYNKSRKAEIVCILWLIAALICFK